MDKRTDPELLSHMGTDAAKWASEFVKLHGGDEGLMLGWFANAIEAGRSAGHADDGWGKLKPRGQQVGGDEGGW